MNQPSDTMTIRVNFNQLASLIGGVIDNGFMTVPQPTDLAGPLPLRLGDHDMGLWTVESVETVYAASIRISFMVTLRKAD